MSHPPEDVESRLNALLSEVAHLAPAETFEEAREYLDHAGYGLALDTIAGTLALKGARVDQTLFGRFVDLGRAMGMEDEFWERIRPLPNVLAARAKRPGGAE